MLVSLVFLVIFSGVMVFVKNITFVFFFLRVINMVILVVVVVVDNVIVFRIDDLFLLILIRILII